MEEGERRKVADLTSIAEKTFRPDTVAERAAERYRNAYTVARATDGIGSVIKFIGIALGIIVALVGFIIGSGNRGSGIFVIGGLLLAAVIGIPLYVLGVLVSAHGQVLKANLDEAVHTSPFLTDQQRASVMSLDNNPSVPCKSSEELTW